MKLFVRSFVRWFVPALRVELKDSWAGTNSNERVQGNSLFSSGNVELLMCLQSFAFLQIRPGSRGVEEDGSKAPSVAMLCGSFISIVWWDGNKR
jgi:hypothetical protein